jgi:hypothetical protein
MYRFFPLLFAFIAGCSSVNTDVSDHEYFEDYTDTIVQLKRDQKLCLVSDDNNYRVFRTTKLRELDEWCQLSEIALVPTGTEVKIQRVMKHWVPVSGNSWYALGSVVVGGQEHEFEYMYGYLHIYRAPWEDNSVPNNRPAPQ